MLAVKVSGLDGAEKELGAVRAGTSVGHRKYARTGMAELKVLVLELRTVDRLTTGAVKICEVTTLAHEARDDTVED